MHRLMLMLPNLTDHHCCAKLGPSLPGGMAHVEWYQVRPSACQLSHVFEHYSRWSCDGMVVIEGLLAVMMVIASVSSTIAGNHVWHGGH